MVLGEMANPRTPVDELILKSSPNLNRALKREKEESAPLTPDQRSRLAAVDALISQSLKACKRGQTFKGRRNSAFANLESVYKIRKMILLGKDEKREKSAAEVLDDARNLFSLEDRKSVV